MSPSNSPLYILSSVDFGETLAARIRAVSERIVLTQRSSQEPAQLLDEFARTEVVYTYGTLPPSLDQAPHLAWVQLLSAGADHILAHPVFKAGVTVTTTSGLHATGIAEYVMASILAWARRLPIMLDCQRRGVWPQASRRDGLMPRELRGATLGIVGYGSIGREVGRLACALGMQVLAVKRHPLQRQDAGFSFVGDVEGCLPQAFYSQAQLLDVLPLCDYVVLAVPLTSETHHLIGERELRAMKSGAYLVNIARGGVLDEVALVRALQEGWIAGAGLDVFEQEPLPSDSPLWTMEQVILTPHVAGYSPHYTERSVEIFVENLRRYLDGQPLLNVVDASLGY